MATAFHWAIVIIHFRGQQAVDQLLRAVDTWTVRPDRIVVVDNSGDFHPPVRDGLSVERPATNLGYAGAANVGLALLPAEQFSHVLLLTQDAVLDPGAAEVLLRTGNDDERVGAVGPLLAFASDPAVLFSRGGLLSSHGIGTHPGQGDPLPVELHGAVDADWLDGAVLLLSSAAVRAVGGFDERYFLYYEEIDLQVRLRTAQYRVVLQRDALAHQEPGNYRTYFKYRNGVFFTRKFPDQFRNWPVARQFVRDGLRRIVRGRSFQPVWAVRGVVDARRGRMGAPPAAVLGESGRTARHEG